MIRKYILFTITGLVLCGLNSQSIFAQQKADNDLNKVKTAVRKIGTGQEAKATVVLKNGITLKGHISQILEDSFDLIDPKSKQPTTVPFREVAKVKKQGWSKGAKFALGVGIGAAVVIAVVAGGIGSSGLGGICPLGCSSMLRP